MNVTLSYPADMPVGTLVTMSDGKYWRVVERLGPGSYVLKRAWWWQRVWWRLVARVRRLPARVRYIMDWTA